MIAAAARGSVGETTAPSANAAPQGSPAISSWASTAIATIVVSTRPTEASVTPRRLARMSLRLAKNAAPYSSGGRKITSTTSGFKCTRGRPGRNPNRAPPITRTIG
jgi:hypothetical protein